MNFLTDMELEAIFLSLKAAFWGTACALPFALLLALVMHRFHFPGKSLLNTLIHLPLIIPPVALGYLLLLLFGRRGVLGRVLGRLWCLFRLHMESRRAGGRRDGAAAYGARHADCSRSD